MRYIIIGLFLFVSTFKGVARTPDVDQIIDSIEKYSDEPKTQLSFPEKSRSGAKVTKVSDSILRLDYEGFTVWLDCKKRGTVKFRYTAQHDDGPVSYTHLTLPTNLLV